MLADITYKLLTAFQQSIDVLFWIPAQKHIIYNYKYEYYISNKIIWDLDAGNYKTIVQY